MLRLATVILAFLLGITSQASTKVDVAVLMSDSLTATKRTLHGAQKVIMREHPEATFHSFYVNQSPDKVRCLVDSLESIRPNLLLTIGSSATQFAQDNFTNVPIVFAAVMYPALSGFVQSTTRPGGNITGASIDIPIDVQFRYFKKIVHNLRRIGVLYTGNTASLIPPAAARAKTLGLTLIPIKVSDIKELPRALDSLAVVVDGIWSVADPNLFDPQSTRYILLNTLRKGIPFMGFSRNVVESGALFALDFDYKAVGHQAGGIANRVIDGKNPGEISVTSADVIWFHYNEKTAKHIDVTIPKELVAVAKEVYR